MDLQTLYGGAPADDETDVAVARDHVAEAERLQGAQRHRSGPARHLEPAVVEVQRRERRAGVHSVGQRVALFVVGVGDAELQEPAAPAELAEDPGEPLTVQAHESAVDLESRDRRGAAVEDAAECAHPACRVLAAVLVALLVGEAAAVEGGGAEDQARERGEDAGPPAGEHDRGRRVAERQADEDGVEGAVVERAEPVLRAGLRRRRAPCPLRRRRGAFLVHGRNERKEEEWGAKIFAAFLSRQIVQCAPFFRSFFGNVENFGQKTA